MTAVADDRQADRGSRGPGLEVARSGVDRLASVATRVAFPARESVPRVASVLVLLVFCWALVASVVDRPLFNWDIVPYTAATLATAGMTPEEVRRSTWEALEPYLSPGQRVSLESADAFRRSMSTDADAFESVLPIYRMKMGYVLTLKLVTRFTQDPVRSIRWVAISCALVTTGLLCVAAWRARGWLKVAWLPLVGLLDVQQFARLASPDILTTCFYTAGLLLMIRRRPGAATAFLLLGMAIRPDHIVLNFALAGPLAALSWPGALALVLVSPVLYLVADAWSLHPGWWPFFYFSLVQIQNTLVGFDPPFDLGLYLRTLLRQAALVFPGAFGWAPSLLGLLTIAIGLGRQRDRLWTAMVVAISASMVARFVIFPLPGARLYAPHLFPLAILVLHALGERSRLPSGATT